MVDGAVQQNPPLNVLESWIDDIAAQTAAYQKLFISDYHCMFLAVQRILEFLLLILQDLEYVLLLPNNIDIAVFYSMVALRSHPQVCSSCTPHILNTTLVKRAMIAAYSRVRHHNIPIGLSQYFCSSRHYLMFHLQAFGEFRKDRHQKQVEQERIVW